MTWSIRGAIAVGGALGALAAALLWGGDPESVEINEQTAAAAGEVDIRASALSPPLAAIAASIPLRTNGRSAVPRLAPPAAAAAGVPATIVDFEFRPAALTVGIGDTVTWFNQGPTIHTATSDQGVWDTGVLSRGQSGSFTFRSAGTFPYHCTIHPFMRGTVTVTGLAPTATPPAQPTATPSSTSISGGRAFTLRVGAGGVANLTWATGTLQGGYALLRAGAGGVVVIPLPGSATQYEDPTRLGEGFTCYLLVPVQGDRALGVSDPLCALRGLASGTAPPELAVRFEGPQTARLSWSAVQGADGYLLVPVPAGAPAAVGSGVTSATYPVMQATCFVVVATQRGASVGTSDGVCGLPGIGTLR